MVAFKQHLISFVGAVPSDAERQLSPHPEDKPAPLFAKQPKTPTTETAKDKPESTAADSNRDISEEPKEDSTDNTEQSQISSLATQNDSFNPHYEVDIDGTPVVGDLLKMMFVDHRVVPTIIVS